MNPSLKIREITTPEPEFLKFALNLLNRTQGVGLFDEPYVAKKIESKDSLVLEATIEGEIISVGCADIIRELWYYEPFDAELESRMKGRKIGSFSTLSVIESMQGKGIGQRMSHERLKWLKKKGCNTVFGVSWASGLKNTSNRVFEKTGFKKVKKVDQFYRKEALANPFDCPGCRTQPCECPAILYELEIT